MNPAILRNLDTTELVNSIHSEDSVTDELCRRLISFIAIEQKMNEHNLTVDDIDFLIQNSDWRK